MINRHKNQQLKDLREYRRLNHNWKGVRRCNRCESVLTQHHKQTQTYCGHCQIAIMSEMLDG